MPSTRGKAAAAAAQPPPTPPNKLLQDYRLVFSGKFPGYSHKELHSLVMSYGGSVTASVSSRNTHLVCDQIDYNKNAPKVAEAERCRVTKVKIEWLLEVVKLTQRVDPDKYLWDKDSEGDEDDQGASKPAANGTSNGTAKTNGVTNGNKKRPIAVVNANMNGNGNDSADEAKPKAKKTKAASAGTGNGKVNGNGAATTKKEDEPELEEETLEKKIKELSEGQYLDKKQRKQTAIPVDEHCPLVGYQVHIHPKNGMIYDAALNQSSTSNNHNKFYRLQILVNGSTYKTWTRWGRVGEAGQNALLGNGALDDAIKNFEKKFKDKSGLKWDDRGQAPKPNKYAFVERSYASDSEDEDEDDEDDASGKGVKKEEDAEDYMPPESKLAEPVRELMELIFNQNFFQATMSSLNYDANKLPLGKLSKATILRGFQQLKDLAALMDDPNLASTQWNMSMAAATEHLSNTYYSLIPHAFGRNRPPLIRDDAHLKKEIELLESLSDMKDAADIMKIDRKKAGTVHPMDSHFASLGMEEMSPLEHKSHEFSLLSDYLLKSKGDTHYVNYKVQNIFRIERAGEHKRFDDSPFSSIASDKRLLWHGSRCTNFGGILSQGLRIAPPEAPMSGYMFGKGIYLADMSSKSANYCCSYNSNGHALLLLCEAELGDPMQKLTNASYSAGESAKKNDMASTWGMGNTGPSKWIDAGTVHDSLKGVQMPDMTATPGPTNVPGASLFYNEYICYDIRQVKLRYLFHVKM